MFCVCGFNRVMLAKFSGGVSPSAGIAAASGLAAQSLIAQTLKTGDHIICMNDVYGGGYCLLVLFSGQVHVLYRVCSFNCYISLYMTTLCGAFCPCDQIASSMLFAHTNIFCSLHVGLTCTVCACIGTI